LFDASAATAAGDATNGTSLRAQNFRGSAAAAQAALPLLLPPLQHQQQQLLLQELAPLQLTHLDLSNNRQLMVLPACLSLLKQLRVLDVRGCGLRWLGEEVLECGSLQELLLGDNMLVDVPEEISRLQQLQVGMN
jgi:Leucine-rich repeat (LRR) protein